MYKCKYCGKEFKKDMALLSHEFKKHDIIYIRISKSDLNRLLQFIITKEDNLLTRSLLESLHYGERKEN